MANSMYFLPFIASSSRNKYIRQLREDSNRLTKMSNCNAILLQSRINRCESIRAFVVVHVSSLDFRNTNSEFEFNAKCITIDSIDSSTYFGLYKRQFS